MPIFLKKTIGLLILVFSFSAFADSNGNVQPPPAPVKVDAACSIAFDEEGKVLTENSTLCRQDVGLNALTMSVNSVIAKNSAIKGALTSLNVTIPEYTEVTNFISRPVGAVAAASVNICLIIIAVMASYRLFMFGYKGMRDSSIEQAIRDPNVYKAFGGFALVAFLATKVGEVNVAQIIVIVSAVVGLQIATYLLSSMISVFNFDADSEVSSEAYHEFLSQGEIYATGIIHSLYAAQEASLRTNFANVLPESADMLPPENADLGFWDSIVSFFGFAIYKEKDPTNKEYFSGLFNDTSLRLQQTSGLKPAVSFSYQNQTGQNILSSTNASLSIADSRYDSSSKKIVSPLFEKTFEYEDLYENTNVLDIISPMPTNLEPSVVKKIASSGFVSLLPSLLVSDDASESVNNKALITQMGDELVSLIMSIKSQYPLVSETDIIATVQAIAFGSVSLSAINNNRYADVMFFNPFIGRKEFLASSSKEPIHHILGEAISSVKKLRVYNCINNFSSTAEEIRLLADLEKGGVWDNQRNNDGGGDLYPICMLPAGNAVDDFGSIIPEKMLDDAIKLVKQIESANSDDITGNLATNLNTMSVSSKNTFTYMEPLAGYSAISDSGLVLEGAQIHMRNIAKYFARVAAMGRYASLKSIDNAGDEEKLEFLKKIRQQGVVAISSYFMQLSQAQEKYSDIIFNSAPKVTSKSNVAEAGNTPIPTAEWVEEEALIAKAKFLPTNDMTLIKNLQSADVNVAARSMTGDESGASESSMVTELVMFFADVMIPAEEVLTHGFGLSSDNIIEGLSVCTTTTNCVNFKQHPIATISIFGKDMFVVGLTILIADKLVSLLDELANPKNDVDGGIFAGIVSFVKELVAGKILAIIKVLAVLTNILAIFGSAYLFAGIFVGYIIPMMPYIAQIMMWLGWLAEFLILFCVIPLLVAYAFIVKDDGEALFKPSAILSMLASLVLRAPLIFIAFMVFYTLSYAGIYIVNSTLYTMFKLEIASGSVLGILMSIFSSVVFFVFSVGMYFLIFKSLTKMMTEMPDYVLRPMGVDSLNVQVSAGLETFIATQKLQKVTEGAVNSIGDGALSLAKEAKGQKEAPKSNVVDADKGEAEGGEGGSGASAVTEGASSSTPSTNPSKSSTKGSDSVKSKTQDTSGQNATKKEKGGDKNDDEEKDDIDDSNLPPSDN